MRARVGMEMDVGNEITLNPSIFQPKQSLFLSLFFQIFSLTCLANMEYNILFSSLNCILHPFNSLFKTVLS